MMFDHPGKLYLGRAYDFDHRQPDPHAPVMLSSRDLTTHALCIGTTGSGKTGLGIVVLEEALLQGIPCLIVDPKGDLTNLALQFPELSAQDLLPWLDAAEAQRYGVSLEQFAEHTAQRWREGRTQWGITSEMVARLRDRVQFDIYTPGSSAGMPINILRSFAPPTNERLTWERHAEVLRERISQTVQALLALAGFEADPLRSREHILLATLFEAAWRSGQSLDLAALLHQIQDPPVRRIGAFDLDAFFPREERFALSVALNSLIASSAFSNWVHGVPLEISSLIAPVPSPQVPAGKTRAAIFYLAHLSDAERQFFISLLLASLVTWMRAQSGTSILRLLLYFDEVAGYAPPFPRNPPTKTPLMTLVKQGRAAGLGVFLATQNPADIDYKGLSNINTWFLGRLRTARDRERALEGLEGAGIGIDREYVEQLLAALPPRVFLLQTASGKAQFFHTRGTMSFLRGPLTRDQIALLTQRAPRAALPLEANAQPTTRVAPGSSVRPILPPSVPEVFLHAHLDASRMASPYYVPHLLAVAVARYVDRVASAYHDEMFAYLLPLTAQWTHFEFSEAHRLASMPDGVAVEPLPGAHFAELPIAVDPRWMKQAERALIEHVYRTGALTVWVNNVLKLRSLPGELRPAFRQRCEAAARERRDAEAEKLRQRYDRRMAALQERYMREHRELQQDRAELSARRREELLAGAEAVFNILRGRRPSYVLAFGARRRREVIAAEEEVRESEATLAQLEAQMQALAEEYRAALNEVNDKWARAVGDVSESSLLPRKSDISIRRMAIAWVAEPVGALRALVEQAPTAA